MSTESKYARVVAHGSKYYDRANWSKTVRKGLDFALFSVVVSDRNEKWDPYTLERLEGTTGSIGLNIAIRNRTNQAYEIESIRLITSNGQQFDEPTFWYESDPNRHEMFPDTVVSSDATIRWDLLYYVDPKQLQDLEWIKLEFSVWNEEGTQNFKVDSGKIPLGEPTKFEMK